MSLVLTKGSSRVGQRCAQNYEKMEVRGASDRLIWHLDPNGQTDSLLKVVPKVLAKEYLLYWLPLWLSPTLPLFFFILLLFWWAVGPGPFLLCNPPPCLCKLWGRDDLTHSSLECKKKKKNHTSSARVEFVGCPSLHIVITGLSRDVGGQRMEFIVPIRRCRPLALPEESCGNCSTGRR